MHLITEIHLKTEMHYILEMHLRTETQITQHLGVKNKQPILPVQPADYISKSFSSISEEYYFNMSLQ